MPNDPIPPQGPPDASALTRAAHSAAAPLLTPKDFAEHGPVICEGGVRYLDRDLLELADLAVIVQGVEFLDHSDHLGF
jgi:hypothetical protein